MNFNDLTMKTPKINLRTVAAAGRESSFSTETISKGQMPKILYEYKSLCEAARIKYEDEVQTKLTKIENKIDDWYRVFAICVQF